MSGDNGDVELDAGNVNGDVVDDPWPNGAVVGVDIVGAAGTGPAALPATPAPAEFDPADHTVAEVVDYMAANPDDADRVVELERAGRNRVGIVGET